MTRPLRTAIAVVGLALGIAACGSDDANSTATDSAPATTARAASDVADATEPDATEPSSGAFPVTIEHKYGTTTVDAEPTRVVSIGYSDQDFILALGVRPIAVRDWYGDQPYATWPWAQDELGDAQPTVLDGAELNFEQIASLQPDLIIGVSSGMTDTDYATLSQIAPTIAQPGEYIDYGTPWDAAMQQIGDSLGMSDAATDVVAETKALFEAARAAHPEFAGQTAGVAFHYEDQPGAYASGDSRSQLLTELGFVIPPEYDELAGDSFYFSVSGEELATLDTDVIVWLTTTDDAALVIGAQPLRPTLRAYAEGREVVADPLLSGAFSFSSPLSMEYVLDHLAPELALAVDGDPSTVVPSAALLGDGAAVTTDDTTTDDTTTDDTTTDDGAASFDDDQQAAADAWTAVFDSTVAFADKTEHLEDAVALESTVAAYAEAGSAMGGITLQPTAVVVDGSSAAVTYDVLFGDTPAYADQVGTMSLVDDAWVVSRDEFCSFMASARTPCPA